MLELIKHNLLLPASTRLGSLVTGVLVGVGANSTHADWVGTGVAGALLIAADLGLAWLRKKNIQKAAFNKALGVTK